MIGIYIHIPFCERKCSYCDFYSITNKSFIDKYVESLTKEVELFYFWQLDESFPLNVETIFFGGGTPSILLPFHLEKIFSALDKFFNLSNIKEITIECNPGTHFIQNLPTYKSLGINRISIGVQSFVPEELIFLDRIHSVSEAINSIENALKEFNNVSIDLIFSIPIQTEHSLEKTLSMVEQFDLKHVSAYSLIYEKGTKLYKDLLKGILEPKDEESDYLFYSLICRTLRSFGFEHYEVSNFAKPNFECLHNLRYWRHQEYVGFGASAHSYFKEKRYWNFRNIGKYLDNIQKGLLPIENQETIGVKEKLLESLMLGLRSEGIDFASFQKNFDVELTKIANSLFNEWVELGKAKIDHRRVKLTDEGYFVCDKLILDLLEAIEKVTI